MGNIFSPVKRAQRLEAFFNSVVAKTDLSPEELAFLRLMIVGTAYDAATDAVIDRLLKPYAKRYKELAHTVVNLEEISEVGFSHKLHIA